MDDQNTQKKTIGRYEIIREIGRSNDIVYEATDTKIGRKIALKVLNIAPNLTGAQRRERVERFYREARAAGSLTHPRIVTIYEVGEDSGQHFIAMEYLTGQTLKDRLAVGGPLSQDRAVEIALQVLDALSFAHSKGVIHRDIKPENIHILPNHSIKLTDFGIARISSEPSITADGQVFGTPSYMSPEQIAGGPLDVRTDLFSFGIVLFEMLTGKKPFSGDSVITITYNIMNSQPEPAQGLSWRMQQIIGKALAKNPNQRYQTADEMAADLKAADTISPTAQPGLGPPAAQSPGPPPWLIGGGTGRSRQQQYYPPTQPPVAQNLPPQSVLPDPISYLAPRPRTVLRLPRLTDEQKAFFTVLLLATILSAALVLLVIGLIKGYHNYSARAEIEQASQLNERAIQLAQQGRLGEAISEFEAALRAARGTEQEANIAANLARAYTGLGMQYYDSGDFQTAASNFEQAVRANPRDADAWLRLGNARVQGGMEDAAIAAWENAVSTDPSSSSARDARIQIGLTYIRRGDSRAGVQDYVGARAWYEEARQAAPGTVVEAEAAERIQRLPGY
jgi:serine/threonine protein kinase/predicted negative regulator of RcsB-dependent stress response